MDFELALYTSGTMTAVLLAAMLVVYGVSIRRVFADVTKSTKRALIMFGMSGVMTVVVTVAGLYFRGFFLSWMGFFFAFVVATILYILYPESRRAAAGRAVAFAIAFGMLAENFVRVVILPGYTQMFEYIGLTVLLIASFTYSIVLVRDTPSAFTGSILLVLILYIVTAATAATSFIFIHTEYFIIQSLPIIVSAAVFGSVLRPWRTMITLFIVFLAASMGGGLVWASLLAGDVLIWQFTIVAVAACICVAAPLNFFIQQGADTGARTPRFIGVVLIALSLLILTHTNSWAIYLMEIGPKAALTWNEYMVSVDVILGVIAIGTFALAASAASFGERTYGTIREFVVILGTAIAVLGLYPVRIDRWAANALYPALALLMAAGIILFIRVSVRIYRAGAIRAAQNFMTFVVSALTIGIVVMFSDQIAAISFELVLLMMVVAGALALASSPPVLASIGKRFRGSQVPT